MDDLIEKLHQNHDNLLSAHYAGIREIRDASDVMIKSLVLFKDGGNFSKSEIDTFKARTRKLDTKLSRYDTLQITGKLKLFARIHQELRRVYLLAVNRV